MNPKLLFPTVLLLFLSISIFSQEVTIHGKIVAFKEYPLQSVQILAKKSKQQVLSDSIGHFTIKCQKKDVILIEAAGFENYYIKIKNDKPLDVNLIYNDGKNTYNEVLNNNYLSKEKLDYALSNLWNNNNNFDKMRSIYEVIQTIHPSAKITNETGRQQVILDSRGVNSAIGDPSALLVVDGIVTDDISTIQPSEIKEINVLIGNEAAHWGSRAANGVIEIYLN